MRSETLRVGTVELNPTAGIVTARGQNLDLSRREFQLLRYLMEHPNQVVSRETLLERVWGYDFEGSDQVVDNHIRKLRKHLGADASCIHTVIGMGYKLEAEP